MKDPAYTQDRLLKRIKSLVEEDERIRGLWVVGSIATGKADRYSDLDVYILIEKEKYEEVFAERASFAERMGKVLSFFEVEWPSCQLYGVILESCVEVDLCYCTPEQVETFGPYRVVGDKEGDLEGFLAERNVGFKTDVKKRLIQHLDFAAYNLLHAINMLGRGEYWSSIRQLEMLRKRIIGLIGLRTQSDVGEEYRRLEALIDQVANEALQRTLCEYTSESIAEAIQTATALFMHEAEEICGMQGLPFPTERFERLLGYLGEIRSETEGASISV
ncbi:MAG: aminoglycoside 6-adenylyltransferase [Candidatus Geothermarchaeales archaeon]